MEMTAHMRTGMRKLPAPPGGGAEEVCHSQPPSAEEAGHCPAPLPLTAVLILATAAYVTYTFWRASTPYGDILESVRTRKISITLAAYLCVAALFLLFEFIALLWSITRVRVRDELGYRKEDAGRGLVSFLLVFASSYLAFLLYRFLPETPEILYGLKGALEVYGSMHNVLFGFCTAGVVSCLVRRYFSH